MLSIALMAMGNDRYYTELAQNDYYSEGAERSGYWWGNGAAQLGLTGRVRPEDLESVFRGFSSTGTALVQNAGKADRQPGWDLTFSVPKWLSILWFFATPEQRKQIEQAIRVAVEAELLHIQEEVAVSRLGSGGKRRVKAELVVALFFHFTSREGDPQLHVHALVLNVCVRLDGTTGTIVSRPLFEHKMVAGALFRATLAAELQQRLNLVIQPEKNGFRIAGVPEELVQHFSKRREQIKERLAQRGEQSAKAAAIAALDTRKTKGEQVSCEELVSRWRSEASALGYAEISAFAPRVIERVSSRPVEITELVEAEINKFADSPGVVTQAALLRRVAVASIGQGFSGPNIRQAVTESIAKSNRLFPLARALKAYGFKRDFRVDKAAFRLARKLRVDRVHGVSEARLRRVLNWHSKPRSAAIESMRHHIHQFTKALKKEKTQPLSSKAVKQLAHRTLSTEEQRFVREAVGRRRGGLRIVACPRGRGRLHILRTSREALEKQGYRVVLATATRAGARKLEAFTGGETITFRSLEARLHPSLGYRTKHVVKQVVRALRGRRTFGLPIRINARTAVILNEGRYLNTRRFKLFTRAVQAAGGMIVIVGDSHARRGIRPRGMFEALVSRMSYVQEVRGQGRSHNRRSRQSPSTTRYQQVTAAETEARLLADWFASTGRHAGRVMIFCERHEDAARMNRLCQAERIGLGELRGKCITIKDRKFFEGDRVHFPEADKPLGIFGGETGVIIRLRLAQQTVVVRLDGGGHLTIPLIACQSIQHGYALPVGVRHQRQLADVMSLGEIDATKFVNTVGPNDPPSVRTYVTEPTQRQETQSRGPKHDRQRQHQQGYGL